MRALVLGCVFLLAGCAEGGANAADPDTPVTAPAKVEPAPPPPADPADPCGAAPLQSLVGQDKATVPPTPPGATWRVHSTTDAVTEDLRRDRLNIVWDAESGKIVRVACG